VVDGWDVLALEKGATEGGEKELAQEFVWNQGPRGRVTACKRPKRREGLEGEGGGKWANLARLMGIIERFRGETRKA